jgi:hypothetical protein
MLKETVTLQIEDETFRAAVEFDFTKGQEAITGREADDYQEGVDDSYEIQYLTIIKGGIQHPANFLIGALNDQIVEKLEKIKV